MAKPITYLDYQIVIDRSATGLAERVKGWVAGGSPHWYTMLWYQAMVKAE